MEPEESLKFSQEPTIFIMLHSENIQEGLDDIWYRRTSRKFNLGQYRFSESQIQKITIFIPTPTQQQKDDSLYIFGTRPTCFGLP